jgi:hypothetical protein
MEKQKELYLVCECYDMEHMFRLTYLPDEKDVDRVLYLETHLRTWKNIFQRYWEAVKYFWGYKSRYGEFDEILLGKEKAIELIKFLQEYLDTFEKKEK